SKSIGNVISPMDVIKKYGVDAMRFYIMRSSAPWEDLPFSWTGVLNANRNLNVLWNVVVFSTTYMALDKFDPAKTTFDSVRNSMRVEDRWLYSRLENLKKAVTENIKIYNFHLAMRAIEDFALNDLSRWYVKLVRDRTWVEGDDPDKLAAYRTLYDALIGVAKLMAPFAPFISEQIYQNLDGSLATVHMCDWPKVDETLIDAKLEGSMSVVRDLVEAAANARQKAQMKLRWPVKRIIVASESPKVLGSIESLESLVKDQINVKKVEFISGVWGELKVQFVPKQGAIGPAFKKEAGLVLAGLKAAEPKALKEALAKEGKYALGAGGKTFEITPEMIEFSAALPEKIAGAEFSGGTVY
ncbi:MAG: isoleucine--tRNA ligase, partial [Thermoplasmata archaeon HGW-Thermoplasmata-2]